MRADVPVRDSLAPAGGRYFLVGLEGNFLSLLTAPIIYSLLLPFVVLDLPRLSDSSRVHGSSLLRWLATASSMPCMAMF